MQWNPRLRIARSSTPTKQLEILINWLQETDKNNIPEIFAEEPYTLPKPAGVDLHIVTVNNTATKALTAVNTLSSDLSKISDNITLIKNGMLYASVFETKILELAESVTLIHEKIVIISGDVARTLRENLRHCDCEIKCKDENNGISEVPALIVEERDRTTTSPTSRTPIRGHSTPVLGQEREGSVTGGEGSLNFKGINSTEDCDTVTAITDIPSDIQTPEPPS